MFRSGRILLKKRQTARKAAELELTTVWLAKRVGFIGFSKIFVGELRSEDESIDLSILTDDLTMRQGIVS